MESPEKPHNLRRSQRLKDRKTEPKQNLLNETPTTPKKTTSLLNLSSSTYDTPKRSRYQKSGLISPLSTPRRTKSYKSKSPTFLDSATPISRYRKSEVSASFSFTPSKSSKRSKSTLLTPLTPTTPRRLNLKSLTPSIPCRRSIFKSPSTPRDHARMLLQLSSAPDSLPCREKEFSKIYSFVRQNIIAKSGGCMYISGISGTGKTATVKSVIQNLEKESKNGEISKFKFVEINCFSLTNIRQIYSSIWELLTNEIVNIKHAKELLIQRFTKSICTSKPVILLIDEFDRLQNTKQDVIYDIFEWSRFNKLTVLTIANTMDLPERILKPKNNSRMQITRLPFQPYSYEQLEQIILNRLEGNNTFSKDAIELISRKVAHMSGDARKALSLCTLVIDETNKYNESVINIGHVSEAFEKIFANSEVTAIKKCSVIQQIILRAMRDEILQSEKNEFSINQIYKKFQTICSFENIKTYPSMNRLCGIVQSLVNSDAVTILDKQKQLYINSKIRLNVDVDDIYEALICKS